MDGCKTAQDSSKNEQPNWIFRYLATCPGTVFGITLLIQITFPVTTAVLYYFGEDVLPVDFKDVPLVLQDDVCYRRAVAWNRRQTDPNERIFVPEAITKLNRLVPAEVIELYYESRSKDNSDHQNMLTLANLRKISRFENSLLNLPQFDQFCALTSLINGSCHKTRSMPNLMLEIAQPSSLANDSSNLFENETVFEAVLNTVYRHRRDQLVDFVNSKAKLEQNSLFSTGLRSYLFLSWVSLNGSDAKVKTSSGTLTASTSSTKDYMSNVLSPIFWNYSNDGHQDLTSLSLYYFNSHMYFAYLPTQVQQDQMLVIGSFLFITVFLLLETQSLFISFFGLHSIVTSFFGANLIYRYVFDYRYFGVFHVLSIFIILGIGVDDIFIFNDAWSASFRNPCNDKDSSCSLAVRISEVFRKAATSMLITSLTTAVSFFLNGCSPLLAISSFGTFSGLLVTVNFIAIITHFPSVVVLHHVYFSKSGKNTGNSGILSKTIYKRDTNTKRVIYPLADEAPMKAAPAPSFKRRRICSRYLNFISTRGIQLAIALATTLVLTGLCFSITKLTVDTEPVKLYRPTHKLAKALFKRQTEFNTPYYEASSADQIYLVWGIEDLNRSHCHWSEWRQCEERVVWDDYFDLNPYHAQKDLLEFCRRLQRIPRKTAEKLRIKVDKTTGTSEVSCFIEQMETFLEKEFKSIIVSGRKYSGLPASNTKMEALMLAIPSIYNLTNIRQNPYFYRYFETAMLYWLYDGYKTFMSHISQSSHLANWLSYGSVVGHSFNSIDLQSVPRNNDESMYYGTKLKYAAIMINVTLSWDGIYYADGLEVLKRWEDFIEAERSRLSPSIRGVRVVTPDKYGLTAGMCHWFKIQETLVQSAIIGIVMSLAFSVPLLVLTTNDFLIGTLASLTIFGATACVIGIIPLVGWKLGVLESLNLTMIVGLSIDYIVHLAEAYHLSKEPTRLAKIAQVVEDFGVSVVCGASTTLGASFFMLFAQVVFFMQHGLFMFACTGFAVLFAMGIFIILLSNFGPENDRFSVSKFSRRLWNALIKFELRYGSQKPEARLELISENSVAKSEFSNSYQTKPVSYSSPLSLNIDDDNLSSGYESGSGKRPRLNLESRNIAILRKSQSSNGECDNCSSIADDGATRRQRDRTTVNLDDHEQKKDKPHRRKGANSVRSQRSSSCAVILEEASQTSVAASSNPGSSSSESQRKRLPISLVPLNL